jgi:hypothetical protein
MFVPMGRGVHPVLAYSHVMAPQVHLVFAIRCAFPVEPLGHAPPQLAADGDDVRPSNDDRS